MKNEEEIKIGSRCCAGRCTKYNKKRKKLQQALRGLLLLFAVAKGIKLFPDHLLSKIILILQPQQLS
jgi:hypothetical protein